MAGSFPDFQYYTLNIKNWESLETRLIGPGDEALLTEVRMCTHTQCRLVSYVCAQGVVQALEDVYVVTIIESVSVVGKTK